MKNCLIVVAVVVLAFGAGTAHAAKGDGQMPLMSANADGSTPPGPLAPDGVPDALTTIDITGYNSWDGLHAPPNEILQELLGAGAIMTGIGWDVTITTQGGSWLSEAVTYFDGQDLDDSGLFLTPGVGDGFPGTASYSSGGILDLTDVMIPNIPIGDDGTLYLEFFESFDDAADAIDATYDPTSTYDIAYIAGAPVPTVPTAAMILLAVALVGLGSLLLRRRQVTS